MVRYLNLGLNFWIALALALLTAAVYAPLRHAAFLSYDDIDYVVDNPHVNAGLTRDGFVWAWTGVHQATWHPLTTLSHMLDCQLFGLQAGAHHLGNVALHVLNTLLLFGVFVRMTAQPWRSACVAGLFALHPLHVESVAWISERKDVLSTFFWMLTLWSYVAYVRRPGIRSYAVVMLGYVAALLSKPMAVTLPFVLLLLDVWPLGRVPLGRVQGFKGSWVQGVKGSGVQGFEGPPPLPRTLEPLNPRTVLLEKLPLLILAAIVSAITFIVQSRAVAVVPLTISPFADRAANAVLAYARYLEHMLWPAGLAVFYPFEAPLPGWKVAAAAGFLVAMSIALVWGARRRAYLLVGWLWYLGVLVPVIGLVRVGENAMADRFTYVSAIGIFIIAAWGIPDLMAGWKFRRAACALIAILALATCSVLTVRQVQFWENSLSLFQHALAVTPNNYLAHVNVGMALAEQGQDGEALEHLSAAVRIKPSYPVAQYALGVILDKRGDHSAAKEHLLATLRLDPYYSQAHMSLGSILAAEGDRGGAVVHYREALRLNPDLPGAHDSLAMVLDEMGQHDAALAEYAQGVRLAPQRAAAQCNLAEKLGTAGHLQEAVTHFRLALQLDPHFLQARYGLAIAQAKSGQLREAVAEFETLLRVQPNSPVVETMLAWLLATPQDPGLRDGPRATRLAEDAAQRTGHQDPDVLNSLAAAYAESGRFGDAVATAQLALERARAGGRTALAAALADRLALYRAGQPARDLMRGMQP